MGVMGIADWSGINWLQFIQSVGIIGGLLFTAYSMRADSRERKVQSVFTLTAAHRDIWSKVYEHPHLVRVLRHAEADSIAVSKEEELFVHMLILHLSSSYLARKLGMYFQEEGLRMDIKEFFSRPIPKAVWEKSKQFQDRDFVEFVESCL